jgi:ABC-type antimicrobial peptide transport system permease subunit
MGLIAGFSLLALVLAAVGIYGVIGYSVAQRSREIGIRMALGAQRGEVLRMVLAQALRLTLAGVAAGAAGAWFAARLIAGLLFGIEPSDPITFATVSLMLMAVAAAAALVPSLRATRIDPSRSLRGN